MLPSLSPEPEPEPEETEEQRRARLIKRWRISLRRQSRWRTTPSPSMIQVTVEGEYYYVCGSASSPITIPSPAIFPPVAEFFITPDGEEDMLRQPSPPMKATAKQWVFSSGKSLRKSIMADLCPLLLWQRFSLSQLLFLLFSSPLCRALVPARRAGGASHRPKGRPATAPSPAPPGAYRPPCPGALLPFFSPPGSLPSAARKISTTNDHGGVL